MELNPTMFSRTLKEHRTEIVSVLLPATAFAAVCSHRYMGNLHALGVLLLAVWLPYSAYVILAKPGRRWVQLARVCIWTAAVCVAGGIHHVRAQTTRANADEIVAAVSQYRATHGHCVRRLDEIGISSQQLKDRLGKAIYVCRDGRQAFVYSGTYGAFDRYSYDFDAHAWVLHPD